MSKLQGWSETRIRVYSAPWYAGVEAQIVKYDGKDVFVGVVEFKKVAPMSVQEPSIHMTMDDAQELMDGLYHCGLRPTQEGRAGALGATEKHLSDIQKIAFGLLKKHGVDR